ncbi:TPA: hypothetical protein HA251_01595 [Candidatus Woesearchaeota archaeon]|nr:hypothetical protein [Candidatus Woesearchaeota archaeon]
MRSIAVLLIAMFIVGVATFGCTGSTPDAGDTAAPADDASVQVVDEFENSLPDDTIESATSDLDSLDSDLASI